MNENMPCDIIFGPVPSRRLGRSLGINNIPPTHCTYSCVYCQLGRNKKMEVVRRQFYDTCAIIEKVEKKISDAYKKNEHIDYLTFVPDGEPTLDINIGTTIKMLKRTGIKIAVITNSSLIMDEKVRADIMGADWVSLKIDAIMEQTWSAINRPHKICDIKKIRKGMFEFAGDYRGILATETMLVDGFNTDTDELNEIADFIGVLKPAVDYLSIPTRPPAEIRAAAPDEFQVNRAYQIMTNKIGRVECITGYEGDGFALTGDIIEDILSITSVHPMREDGIKSVLRKANADWSVIERLICDKKLSETEYNGKRYYLRRFNISWSQG